MGGFPAAALFSENYLDPSHDKFLNTPLVYGWLFDAHVWMLPTTPQVLFLYNHTELLENVQKSKNTSWLKSWILRFTAGWYNVYTYVPIV